MMRINILLAIVLVIGTCLAAETVKTKTAAIQKSPLKPAATEEKKEKRDAAVSSGPYSYEPPQKSYQLQLPSTEYKPSKVQQSVNYYQKPAPVEIVHIPKKVAATENYQHAKQQQSGPHDNHYSSVQFSYPLAVENYLQTLPLKNNYPSEAAYHQPSNEQQTSSYYYKYPSSSEYKSPSAGYNYAFNYQPLHTAPQHQSPISYEPQNHQQQQYYFGYPEVQSPPQLFYPYVEEQNHNYKAPAPKLPEYALGHKGLGHFASYHFASPIQQTYESYVKPQQFYEQPIYTTQTERPFNKPSVHLSTPLRAHESYNEQLINSQPSAAEYLPPKQTYLPSREEIFVQPSKNYLPVKESVHEYVQQPSKTYLPTREDYLTPSKTYYRPKEISHPQKQVEYQVQYITVPEKSYLPPSTVSHSYIPPKKIQESPKNTYIPPVSSTTSKPTYASNPPKQTYLPPNNPYQQSNYDAEITHYSQSQYDHQDNDQFDNNNNYHPQQFKRSSSSSSSN